MSIFDVEDKIDYNWLIDNGFSVDEKTGVAYVAISTTCFLYFYIKIK